METMTIIVKVEEGGSWLAMGAFVDLDTNLSCSGEAPMVNAIT